MNVSLEPAIFLFRGTVGTLVNQVKESGSHISFETARQIVAKALGYGVWHDLSALSVEATGALLDGLNRDHARVIVADELAARGIQLPGSGRRELFDLNFGYAFTKPASVLCAMFDGRMTFHGILMGNGGWHEHHFVPNVDANHDHTIARKVRSTSDGIVGLNRSLFRTGDAHRLLLDEAIEEELDGFGCVPFLHASKHGQTNVFTMHPQFLHGGWSKDRLLLAGNGEASALVSQVGEWQRQGELVAIESEEGIFVCHRAAPDVAGLRRCFQSGWLRSAVGHQDGERSG